MKYAILTILTLTTLLACSAPIVYDDGYNDGNDRYDDGYYRYNSRARSIRYDNYLATDAYGRTRGARVSNTGYNRYDAYGRQGHSLHSSKYQTYQSRDRRRSYRSNLRY